MDIIETLAQNALNTKFEDLPEEAIQATKNSILDTLGVLVAGSSDCRREVDLVKEWGGKSESTILVYGGRVPAPNAAWANTIMAVVADFDDVIEGGLHVSACAVPAALAVSEMRGGVNGKEMISAITVGEDLVARIHLASGNWGIHTTGLTVGFGIAALSARLLGLDLDGMLNALGIAFMYASGSRQASIDKVFACRLIKGVVSRSGIEAAILAQRGATGIKNILQGEYGFFNLFARRGGDLAVLTDQLGKRYEGVRSSIKQYASCGRTHSATEAAVRIVRETGIDPKEINQITVGVSEFVHAFSGQPFEITDNPRLEAQYSIAYSVANALFRKASLPQHFSGQYVRDPEVVALAQKVHSVINSKEQDLSAVVTIEMKDGRKYSKSIRHDQAVLESSHSTEEVKVKFRACVALAPESVAEANCERIIHTVDKLEEVDDVCQLVKLLM